MGKLLRIGIILLLFMALALVRFFEESLFYDPLLAYFKGGGYLEKISCLHLNSGNLWVL